MIVVIINGMPRRGLCRIYVGSFILGRLIVHGLRAPRDVMLPIKTRLGFNYFTVINSRRWSMIGGDVPINWWYPVLAEIGVGFRKWRTAKKSIMRGQW